MAFVSEQPFIVTCTVNPSIDECFHVDEIQPDVKLKARDVVRDPGGGGINAARVLSRLGARVLACGFAGGTAGKMLAELLDREKLPYKFTRVSDETRINMTAVEDSTGHEFRFNMPGPRVKPAEHSQLLRNLFDLNEKPDVLIASGSLTPGMDDDFYAMLVRRSHERGVPCMVDFRDQPLKLAIAAGADYIKPNEHELEKLIGRKLRTRKDQVNACRSLVKQGCGTVLLSLGSKGAVVVTSKQAWFAHAPKVTTRSVVGAGDSMAAAFVYQIARGESLREALRFGAASGAASVLHPGTQLAFPDDIKRLLPKVTVSRLD